MTNFRKGLLIAALQVLVVTSLGGKMLFDRATRPRVWVKSQSYDPSLPIRGRYVSLSVDMDAPMLAVPPGAGTFRLQPRPEGAFPGLKGRQQVVYFIPEHVADPSRREPGEELWVEVTIPRKGPPRPIQLAVKRGDELTLLSFR